MLARIRNRHFFHFLLVVLVVLLAAIPILTYPMGRDQGMYANIGRSILNGGIPYIDMWDIKPPPIYYIYAFGIRIFGTATASIRAIDLLFVPFGMLGLWYFGSLLKHHRLGLLTALIYGVFYFNEDFQNLTQSDSLVTILMIWAAYATYRSSLSDDKRFSWRWAFAAGAICGFVLWFKHYYAFFVLALVINRMLARKSGDNNGSWLIEIWHDALAFASGGLLTGGALLLYFWSQGMISEMLIVAQGTAAYNAQGYDFGAFIANMQNYLWFRFQTWHTLLIMVGLAPMVKIINILTRRDTMHRVPTNNIHKIGWRLAFSWLVAALAFALIQAKGFDTHWIPMLPVLALIAAATIDEIIQKITWRKGAMHCAPTDNDDLNIQEQTLSNNSIPPENTLAIVLYGLAVIGLLTIPVLTTWGRAWQYISGQENRVAYFDRFQANDLKPEESLLMAYYLRERVSAGDSLFIFGFRPEVYYMAQLNPATRFQAQFPLVAPWYPPDWREENVEILRAALPPYALIVEDDFMPWVTNIDADSHTILQDSAHDDLRFWYQAHYEVVDEIGDFIIWRRQP